LGGVCLKVKDLGERSLIERFFKIMSKCEGSVLPLGDDAVGYLIDNEHVLVINVDMLVWGTDVPPGMSFRQVGRKVVTMCVSDVAVKGAKPLGVLISIGIPENFSVDNVEEIIRGVNEGSHEYGACFLGGDTNECNEFVLDGVAFGMVNKSYLISRSGAKPGDILAITGYFGYTAAGLKILLENLSAPNNARRKFLDAVYNPKARVKEAISLAQSRALTSSIDSSDGLAWSLYELSKASSVGFIIRNLPVPEEVAKFAKGNNLDPFDLIFYGGEEFELVVTVKPSMWDKAVKAVEKVGGTLIKIGEVTKEKKIVLIDEEGTERKIEPRGYEHFTRC